MSFISQFETPNGSKYPIRASGIPYGECDSTSTATEFTATVPGVYELTDGTCMWLKNGVVTSASGFTININGLGAKPVYSNLAAATRDTTLFNINYTMLFVYDSDRVTGGCWICYRGYDSNTNTIGYQIRTNSGNLEASDTGHMYRLWFTSADGKKWVPANTSTSDDATTSRTMNTRPINPFGPIVYNSTNGSVSSGARPAVTTLWQQYTLTIGYSYVISLTAWDPVYVQCTPQADGSAVMNAIVKALPTSNDGKIYIYLGQAYSSTAMELRIQHPVFYHDGSGIRVWTGKAIPTKVSELTNDSHFATTAQLPTKVSQLTNDSHFATTAQLPTKTSDLTNDGDGNSAFATMADIGDLGGGTITSVKTTAGTHTTINVTSGNAEFNVPTKTSHLTNDSGFATTSWVGNQHYATTAQLPTKVSQLTNDSGFITGGTISTQSFTGTLATISMSIKPTGSVSVTTATGTSNYTPAGTVTLTPVLSKTTASLNKVTGLGSLPSYTLPSLGSTYTTSIQDLAISLNPGTFSAGSLPTTAAQTYVTAVAGAGTTGTFTGTGVRFTGSFTGDSTTVSTNYTPAGTISRATFTSD